MSSTPFHLTGQKILVTGASSGIGKQVSLSVAEMGGNVILNGRHRETLETTMAEMHQGEHQLISADLSSEAGVEELARELPSIDGVVHCAGIVDPYPIKFLSKEKLDQTFDVNYQAPVLLMSRIARLKKLNRDSSIVFLSSIGASRPYKGGTAYCGSKLAIEAFSKVLALELHQLRIRCNCLAPGMVKTAMYDKTRELHSKEQMEAHERLYPLGVGEPLDVALAAVFLLSNASRWITGTTITLDGGFLLGG